MKKERTESQLQLRLRKNQSDLVAIGLGVIAFGVWSVIKTVLYVAFHTESVLGSLEGDKYLILTFWILLGGVLAIGLALRLYIGLSAIAEGKGKKRKAGYIVLSLLMSVLSFVLLAGGEPMLRRDVLAQGFAGAAGNTAVTLMVEMTSDVLLLEMSISAIRVRRMKKSTAGAES